MQSVLQYQMKKKKRNFALDVAAHRVKNHLKPLENLFLSSLQSVTIYQMRIREFLAIYCFFFLISIRFVLCGRKMCCFNALFENVIRFAFPSFNVRELVERIASLLLSPSSSPHLESIQFNVNSQTVNKHEQQPPLNHCCSVPDNSSLMCFKCTYYYCLLYLYIIG